MKKIKNIISVLIIINIFFLIPICCVAADNKSCSIDNNIMNTAINAMRINACAIKSGDNTICTVKDKATAESVIDDFYYKYAICESNEVLLEIKWNEMPQIINVKEDICNILSKEDAINLIVSAANINYTEVAALSIAGNTKTSNTMSVSYTKYVKLTETEEYNTITENSKTLYQDQSQIKQKGIQGVKEFIYKIEYINDKEQKRELVKSKELIKPQEEIIIRGTKIREYPEYILPTTGFVSSVYGERNGELHMGIDIANSKGSPIYAAKDGIVTRTEWYFGYGKCIDIKHNDGSWTRYGHLDKFLVNIGDKVNQGDEIGLMGTTGNSTGYHLHFEIRYGIWPCGRTVDPSYFLDLSKLKN